MDTTFYKTEGILARERPRRCPEVLHDDAVWRAYPELDPLHDARRIDRAEAVTMLPKGKTPAHLDVPGEMDGAVKAPVGR